jgi:putative ATP-dependent endonuclease of OLD family
MDCDVRILEVRIANFRSLKDVAVTFQDVTVFVGPNNVGKTSVLDALHAAIGTGRRMFTQDDVYLEPAEHSAPKERKVVIDILIRPVSAAGAVLESFPNGSYWTNLWGTGISQNKELDDIVAIRSTFSWAQSQGEYVMQRRFLREWKTSGDWLDTEEKDGISSYQTDPVALHYIDAKRDIEDDVRRQGSFWRRLTDDLGLGEDDIGALEAALSQLNDTIVEKSEVLKHLRENLQDLASVVSSEGGGVDITPVARSLRDLSRGVDVTFSNSGPQQFPLARHGMGTRSLASLFVFRAFVSWKRAKSAQANERLHPFLALEEPEAHLHPHAQRAVFTQIKSIPGQRIVSTHSPYFAGQAKLEQLRIFTKLAGTTKVGELDLTGLNGDERRRLEREVTSSRGDILFAKALVLFEGETEEQALPVWAETFWGRSIHEVGFSFVAVRGHHYFPFIFLAKTLGLPWFIFSDGEEKVIGEVKKSLAKAGCPQLQDCPNITVHPNGNSFENQLLSEGYQPEVERAIEHSCGEGHLDGYIKNLHGKDGKRGVKRNYSGAEGRSRAILDFLEENKARMALPIAVSVTGCAEKTRRVPDCAKTLFAQIGNSFNLQSTY